MKILLALAAFALAAALVVSATMGAETLVPGGGSNSPGEGSVSSGKPRVVPTSFAPPSLKGTGFRPRENVTVAIRGGTTKVVRRAKADGSGSFVVRLATRVDRCNGMTVTAVGDKGSRTSFQFSELLCTSAGSTQ